MLTRAKCRVCGGEVYRNSRDETLRHTTAARGGRTPEGWGADDYTPAEICPGSTPGARA